MVYGLKKIQKAKHLSHFYQTKKTSYPQRIACHHKQSGFCHWCRGTHDPLHPHFGPGWSNCTRWEWLFPSPHSRPCHTQLQGQSSRESRGASWSSRRAFRDGEMSHPRVKSDSDPYCLSAPLVSSLLLTKAFEFWGAPLETPGVSSLPPSAQRSSVWGSTYQNGCVNYSYSLKDVHRNSLSVLCFHSLCNLHNNTCSTRQDTVRWTLTNFRGAEFIFVWTLKGRLQI